MLKKSDYVSITEYKTSGEYKRKDPITTKRSWPVYSVMFGMPGYMPDGVCYFTNKRAALGYMADEAKDLRSEDWIVSGSAEYGYTCQAPWHDVDYFSLDWNVEHFSSKAERDSFITNNSEF